MTGRNGDKEVLECPDWLIAGGMVFCSGRSAGATTGDVGEDVARVLASIQASLRSALSAPAHVVELRLWHTARYSAQEVGLAVERRWPELGSAVRIVLASSLPEGAFLYGECTATPSV